MTCYENLRLCPVCQYPLREVVKESQVTDEILIQKKCPFCGFIRTKR